MPTLAALEEVEKSFEEVRALRGLSLTIEAGEVLGLLGPNGAGKTTALKILTGLLAPDRGHVTIGGIDVHEDPLEARRQFSYVPDGAPLYANLSLRQHLTLVGRLHQLDPARTESESERLMSSFQLEDRADDPVGTFSRGMRQKAALACALLPRPRLLILDEPLSGLDAPTTAVIKALLRAWAERGGAVLYTSHLLDVVERVCDRMAILEAGRLIAIGTLDELRESGGKSSGGDSLEQVFRNLTRTEDPEVAALRILGDPPG